VNSKRLRGELPMPKFQASAVMMGLAFLVACTVPIVVGGHWLRLFFIIGASGGLAVAAFLHLREELAGSIAGAGVKDDLRHPVIPRHRLHDVGGALLVVVSAAVLVIGMPTVWYFFALAIGGGLLVAAVMRWART
jgi:hypothetical protein